MANKEVKQSNNHVEDEVVLKEFIFNLRNDNSLIEVVDSLIVPLEEGDWVMQKYCIRKAN